MSPDGRDNEGSGAYWPTMRTTASATVRYALRWLAVATIAASIVLVAFWAV